MITGVLKIDGGLDDDLTIPMTEYFFAWFVVETIKSIVSSNGDYNALTNYYDIGDLECSSVTYIDVFVEQLVDVYNECHRPISLIEIPDEEAELIPYEILCGALGDYHFNLFKSLVSNNSFEELVNIANEVGLNGGKYSATINTYGNTFVYLIQGDAVANSLNALLNS